MTGPPATGLHRTNALTAWYFAGLGATAAVIPAVLPGLAVVFAVPVQSLLPAVPALFLGLFTGVVCAPVLAGRVALVIVLRRGAAAQAVGLAMAGLAPAPASFVVAAAVAGVGFGVVESAGTAVVRLLNNAGTAGRLTSLTAIVGAVATITPLLVVVASALGVVRVALGVAAAIHVAALTVTWGTVSPRGSHTAPPRQPRPRTGPRTLRPVAMYAAALFCYVGAESVLSGWSAATIAETLGSEPTIAAVGTSGFWLLITIGRLLGTIVNRHVAPRPATVLCCSVAACALTASVLVGSRSPPAALSLMGFAVVACGPCYALILGIAVNATAQRRAVQSAAALVAIGALGGATVPLLVLTGFEARSPTVVAAVAMGATLVLIATAPRGR